MMLLPCTRCATPFPSLLLACPTCGAAHGETSTARPLPPSLALVGLLLSGCPKPAPEPMPQPEYGVPVTDQAPAEGAEADGAEDGEAEGEAAEGEAAEGEAPSEPPVQASYGISVMDTPRVAPE